MYRFALLVVAVLLAVTDAYYVPGAKPTFYSAEEPITASVNSLRSNKVLFPKDYYSLPFCRPQEIKTTTDSLGELIWGDRQHNSLYTFTFNEDFEPTTCAVLPCSERNSAELAGNLSRLEKAIEQGYRGFMNIDNLPVFNNGTKPHWGRCDFKLKKDQQYLFQRGYALGVPKACTGSTLLNNHLHFVIYYNEQPPTLASRDDDGEILPKYMVVGLNAVPYSIKHDSQTMDACNKGEFLLSSALPELRMQDISRNSTVYWTYSYEWKKSDVTWATRWDAYFHSSVAGQATATHVAYIFASVVVVLMIAGTVATILMRALRKDIVRYNTLDAEQLQEETGWKLIHGDVFRPPDREALLSALAGSGAQVVLVVFFVVLLSVMGLLSPSKRGSLLIATLLVSVAASFAGGYVCGFLQRNFSTKEWKYVVMSGALMPGSIFAVYLLGNAMSHAKDATTATSFSTMVLLVFIWLTTSLPLTILGASFALNQEPLKSPVPINRLAREIPVQPLMNQPMVLYLVPPLFPLGAILLELQFVMQALWAGQVYYVFWYLMIACMIWFVVTTLVTALQLYYVLCYEDHRWWWVAFATPGCFGLHLFVYTTLFFMFQLSITSFSSGMLYFLYMGVISLGYGMASGAIGLFTGIIFVRVIYGSIKVD